jgi:hypothetical protein
MVHACNLIYSGGRDWEDWELRSSQANSWRNPLSKTPNMEKGVAECLKWWSVCLTIVRSWVQTPVLRKKKKTRNEGVPVRREKIDFHRSPRRLCPQQGNDSISITGARSAPEDVWIAVGWSQCDFPTLCLKNIVKHVSNSFQCILFLKEI